MLENIAAEGVRGRWTMSVVCAVGFLISYYCCSNYQVAGIKRVAAISPFILGFTFCAIQAQQHTWAVIGRVGKEEGPDGSTKEIEDAERAEGIRKKSNTIIQVALATAVVLITVAAYM